MQGLGIPLRSPREISRIGGTFEILRDDLKVFWEPSDPKYLSDKSSLRSYDLEIPGTPARSLGTPWGPYIRTPGVLGTRVVRNPMNWGLQGPLGL